MFKFLLSISAAFLLFSNLSLANDCIDMTSVVKEARAAVMHRDKDAFNISHQKLYKCGLVHSDSMNRIFNQNPARGMNKIEVFITVGAPIRPIDDIDRDIVYHDDGEHWRYGQNLIKTVYFNRQDIVYRIVGW